MSDEFYRALVEGSPEPLMIVRADAELAIVDVTPAWLAHTGATRDIVGKGVRAALPDRVDVQLLLARATESKGIAYGELEGTFRGCCAPIVIGGEVRWLAHRFDDVGTILRANERVAAELEAFRYAVSHDLRFPLRVVDGYTRALQEDCGAAIDEQGKTYMSAIRRGVAKMDLMIRRVCELLELTRGPFVESQLDITAIARAAVAKQSPDERTVAVAVADGLTARGDRRLVEAVLDALIDNAWKFTGKVEAPSIEVARTDEAFFVRDNGTGFDANASRLFAPFRRLHRVEEFPGDGIGLAVVYRAVTRHGGRVWAESEPGKGATLYFTLR